MLIGTYKIVTTSTLCSLQPLLLPHLNSIRPPSVGTSPNSHFRSGRKVMYMKARHTMHMKALAYIDIFACILPPSLPHPHSSTPNPLHTREGREQERGTLTNYFGTHYNSRHICHGGREGRNGEAKVRCSSCFFSQVRQGVCSQGLQN